MTSQQSSQGSGYAAAVQPQSHGSDLNAMAFLFQMFMGKVRTATLVKVVSVTNAGGLSPVGTVDVQPLVNQVDSAQNGTNHGQVHELPYLRLQGGANAIVMDPKVGDIGLAVFADRDISSVKATKARANPGSKRRFDMADGLYIGGFLNGTPTQVLQFTDAGINVISPTVVTVQAPTVNVQAATAANVTAPVINLGAVGQTLGSFITEAFKNLFNGHTHPTGTPNTGAPNQLITASHMSSTVKGG